MRITNIQIIKTMTGYHARIDYDTYDVVVREEIDYLSLMIWLGEFIKNEIKAECETTMEDLTNDKT